MLQLSSRIRDRDRGALSLEDQEAEEVLLAVERRFKDVGSKLSMAACAKRAHYDIASTIQSELNNQMGTGFVAIVIEALGNVIMTIFVIIVVLVIIEGVGGPLVDAMGTAAMEQGEPYIIAEIGPVVEERMGGDLLAQLEDNILNKVGSLVMLALMYHVPRALGKEIPPRLMNYVVRVEMPVLAKSIAHELLHALTQRLIHNLSHVLADTCATEVTKVLSNQLIKYMYCVYCYQEGKFCRECQTYDLYSAAGSQVR